jgi:Kinesin motor domain
MQGFDSALVLYGVTGSGKTHTLCGNSHEKGLLQLFVGNIFSYMEQHSDTDCLIAASATEILEDKAYDLTSGQKLKLREDPQRGFYLEGKLLCC